MVFSPDCLILAIVSAVVYLWKIASGIPNFKGEFDFYPSCGPVSPDKRFFALGADEIVNLYAITGALQQSINTHGRVRTLSFSEDGVLQDDILRAIGDDDGEVIVIELADS
ncbi:hypothetical protein N7513_007830 [Penicillium frequentans]|nr:hypothetical protein N7513_007830 [Penicillium glabrum]